MTNKPVPNTPKVQSNADRLLKHLEADSLAEQLVKAYRGAGGTGRITSAREVLVTRLKQVRASFDRPET